MSFTERLSSLRRLKCTSITEKGPQSVSFIERFLFRVSIVTVLHMKEAHLQEARVVLDNGGKEGPEVDELLLTEPFLDVLLRLDVAILNEDPLDEVTEVVDMELSLD